MREMQKNELRETIQNLEVAEATILLCCSRDEILKDKALAEKLLRIGHEIDDKILALLRVEEKIGK